ncbi:transposase, partial [Elongatibacter sediminis]
IANQPDAIRKWLCRYERGAALQLAFEPTSTYHMALVKAALQRKIELYSINPRQIHHYRYSVGLRHKSDPHDAWLLARYLAHEAAALRPYQPQDERLQRLWALLKRRAKVVKARQQLQQSLMDVGVSCQAALTQLERLIKRMDRLIERLLDALELREDYQRCRTAPGIGPLTAAAMVAAYHRGVFASADAFVAYFGLDVRVRDSGRKRGRRKLTKHGDPEVRRLLFCGSHAARYDPCFAAYYQKQMDKGLCATAARVVLMRKQVRIVFALLSKKEIYRPMASGVA